MKFLKVTVGTVGQTCALFDKPMYPAEIHKAVYTEVQPFSVIAAVMQQVRSRHVFEKRFTTWYLGTCFSTRFNKISFCLGVDSLLRKAYSDSPGVVFWYSEGKWAELDGFWRISPLLLWSCLGQNRLDLSSSGHVPQNGPRIPKSKFTSGKYRKLFTVWNSASSLQSTRWEWKAEVNISHCDLCWS